MLNMEACLRFRLRRVGTCFLPLVVVTHYTISALVELQLLHRVEQRTLVV
jgi:hypothetical protein